MSITSNFPAIKPTLLLDFANTKQLDPRITFTRASTATYYGKQTAKAEENLLLQSQDFATTWTTTSLNATITANTTAAPDGTTTADTLTDDATNGIHRVSQTVTTSNTLQMVYSVFAKYSTMRWISISAATGTGTWAGAKFDVQNGVLGSTSQQGTGFTANSSSITSVGNGWYRCVLVYTAGASGSTSMLVSGATDGTTFTTSQRGSEVYIGSGSAVFLWGAQLEQRSAVSAYTATTTQSITNYIPQLLTAASGVARFDNNPTTFESLGLLIEEGRTNLVTYSEQFDNAAWTKGAATITANTIVAPDGTLIGDKMVEDTANNTHLVQQAPSYTSGTAYTYSVFAKAAERTFLQLRVSASSQFSASFNLSTGVASQLASGTTAAITSVGNGWYRCSITFTATATAVGASRIGLLSNETTQNYTGDGYSGIYIWGAQLEAGAFATSYIPTVASQVTRAADAASMTGTNFSSWYNVAEGTLYAEGKSVDSISGTTARRYAEVNDGSTSNIMSIEFRTTTQSRFTVTVSDTSQATVTSGGTINQFSKIAGSYAVNNFAFCANGALGTSDTSGTVPIVTQLNIGSRSDNSAASTINGTIKKIAYYPLAATPAQLQGLTS